MARPLFQRSPRLVRELPKGEREVPPPPPIPAKPSVSLVAIILPAVASAVGVTFSISMALSRGRGGLGYLGLSLPMTAISVLLPLYNFFHQRRTYKKQFFAREETYCALLDANRREFEQAWQTHRQILGEKDPAPPDCLARAEARDARLWERSPDDADFLALRVGEGEMPFGIKVKVPRQEVTLEQDRLRDLAQGLATDFTTVAPVPVCLPLGQVGVAGVAGPRAEAVAAVRAMVMQIAAHHSPDEVKVGLLFPASEAEEWAWIRWLPHVWSDDRRVRFLASDRDGAHQLMTDLYEVFNRRKLQAGNQQLNRRAPLPRFVLIVADPKLVERETVLPLLLDEGRSLGASLVFLANRRSMLPKECDGIVELGAGGGAQVILNGENLQQIPFTPDGAPVAVADRMARALAALRLNQMASAAEIPGSLPLLELFRVNGVEELDPLARWQEAQPDRTLAVPVGLRTGDEELLIDLHEKGHGPHGLVAGATGSGKSELLQALIASLALHYHPHHVVCVMVDFKGGALANVFADLPHLVGTITNLQGNLATRALAAIRGELRRRQNMLKDVSLDNINDYHRLRDRGRNDLPPMPHLVLVVDEFAELKMEQPDFMRELVSAVRVGRSLGIHLILATQKPAGVVDEQIWSNSRFRLCLRVERPEDSQEVLKRPDAASITRPGRAFFQVGNNEVFELFQAGFGGAPYQPDADGGDPYAIAEVALDGRRIPLSLTAEKPQAREKQLEALVRHLGTEAGRAGIQRLPGPWLPPLAAAVPLDQVRPAGGWHGSGWKPVPGWMEPAIGLVDDPANQAQTTLRVNLGKEGHMVVYGAPGSGKTTLLQTLILSLVLDHPPEDVHLYLLDFGGRTLTLFAELPHVGAVIVSDEAERVNRLCQFLLRELELRKERLSRAGVNTLAAYRQSSGDRLPAIVVVVDNFTGFANAYPDAEDRFTQIAREGGNLGIHLVITGGSPAVVRTKITSNITLALALSLADRGEYSLVVGRTGGLEPADLPGRGLVKGPPPLEFQTALPAPGPSEVERSAALREIARQMAQVWQGPRPQPVRVLPEALPLSDLLTPQAEGSWSGQETLAVPIALEVESLAPFEPDLREGPHFLVAGPVQSGKSTFLQTWVLALAERLPPERLQLYLVDFRQEALSPLQTLPHVRSYVTDDAALGAAIAAIGQALKERRQAYDEARRGARGPFDVQAFLAPHPALVMVADDLDALREGAAQSTRDLLEQLIRRERGLGFHLVVAGTTADFASGWDGLTKALKELQTGVLVGSSDHSDLQLFNLRLPSSEAGKVLPPGQGYYVRRGRFRRVKGATPHSGTVTLADWVERLAGRAHDLVR